MKEWTTACPDWEKRIVKGQSLIPMTALFPSEAEEALGVFDTLRMVDAPGSPQLGLVSRPFVHDFVAQIFGSYDPESGIRHITEYFLLISKKNAKSTNAAGIMLTALILNWRNSAEFIILSPTIEIANNSFKPAADMVRADEELSALLQVQDHIRTITHRVTGATLKVVAAASETVGGKKAVGVLVDELWLLGMQPNAENMLREAIGGLASRPEGFVIYLTTQSDEPPAGVFKQKLDYARKVRDGEIVDPRFLPVLYEFPKRMLEQKAYMEPENFYITNPNLGASVDEAFLLREFGKAQESGEETMRGFLAKHLNVEIGLNLRSDRWPGAEYWEGAELPRRVTLKTLIDRCEVVTGGIDGGGLDDLLGMAMVGRDKDTREWIAYTYAWAHPSVLERRKDIASRLRDFEKAGEMTLVKQIGQDVDELASQFARIEEAGLLFQIGLDPACIGGILDALLLAGIPQEKMVSVNQGWRLAGAIKTTERKLAEGVLKHGVTALMRWCVGNAKVKVSGNAIVITKQVSGTAKIDPLMALFNAVSLMALNPPAQMGYNSDLLVIGG
jgi:phage terminase large subunit-like protein